MYESKGLDSSYGLQLPAKAEAVGFLITGIESTMHLEPGQGPVARIMAASAKALLPQYVSTGEATEEDVVAYVRNSENSNFWSVYYTTVRVVLKRP